MTGKLWTDEEVLAVQKRLAHEAPEAIAADIGRSVRAVKDCGPNGRLCPGKRQKLRASYRMEYPMRVDVDVVAIRPTDDMIRDRDVRAMLPCRDLTAAFFGDPPVGLSALEGRR